MRRSIKAALLVTVMALTQAESCGSVPAETPVKQNPAPVAKTVLPTTAKKKSTPPTLVGSEWHSGHIPDGATCKSNWIKVYQPSKNRWHCERKPAKK